MQCKYNVDFVQLMLVIVFKDSLTLFFLKKVTVSMLELSSAPTGGVKL